MVNGSRSGSGTCPQADDGSAQRVRKNLCIVPAIPKVSPCRSAYMFGMASYTLLLSRGMHFVDEAGGQAILAALSEGDAFVTVDVDLIGDGFIRRGVRLSTSHIVAIIPNDEEAVSAEPVPFGPNVTALSRQRRAR